VARARPMDNADLDLYCARQLPPISSATRCASWRGDDMRETRLRITRYAAMKP